MRKAQVAGPFSPRPSMAVAKASMAQGEKAKGNSSTCSKPGPLTILKCTDMGSSDISKIIQRNVGGGGCTANVRIKALGSVSQPFRSRDG